MALTAAEIQILLSARDTSSATLNRAIGPLKQISSTAQTATVSTQGLSRALGPVPSLLTAASAGARGFAASVTGLIAAAAPIAAAFAGLIAVATIFSAAKTAIIDFNATLEQSGKAWETMLGSAENAKAYLAEIARVAAATPFDLQGLEQATRRMVAYGIAVEDALPFVMDLGNVSAGMGAGTEGIARQTTALGQMFAKGKVVGQELLQLTELGVNVGQIFGIMAEQTGKSTGELKKMQEEGKLTSDVFIKAYRTWAQTRFGDAMAGQAKTFTGAMSAIKDSLLIVASTAFKPLFDRISELAQRFATFVQTDEFQRWGARIAATVDVILSSLGTLASGFWSALSGVLSVVVNVGRAIYEALSYLNPFARHSPSLVESVEGGVDAIIAKYRTLGLITAPLGEARLAIEGLSEAAQKSAVDKLKSSVDALRDRAQVLGDALSVAKGRLSDFLNTPLQGQRAFTDRLDGITDKLAQNRLKLLRMDMRLDPRVGRGALRREGRQLEKEAELVRLEEMVALGPQKRAIAQAGDTRLEQPFDAILAGVREATRDIATLEPVVLSANAAWKEQAEILQDVQRAISAAKGGDKTLVDAMAGGIGDLSFLDELKEKQREMEENFKRYRDQVIKDAAPFVNAVDSMSAALKRFGDNLKTFGLAGGLSELLFPTPQRVDDLDATLSQERGIHGDAAFLRQRPRFNNLPDIGAELTEWMKAQVAAIDWNSVWANAKGHGTALVASLPPIGADVGTWFASQLVPGLNQAVLATDFKPFWSTLFTVIIDNFSIKRGIGELSSLFTGSWRDTVSQDMTRWAQSDWFMLVFRIQQIIGRPLADAAQVIGKLFTDTLTSAMTLFNWSDIGKSIAQKIIDGIRAVFAGTPLESLIPRPSPDFVITPESIRSTAPARNTGGFRPGTPNYDVNDPSVRGYQHGGSWKVGGIGGRDSQMVQFMASPDETVMVMTPQQRARAGGGGGTTVVNNYLTMTNNISKEVNGDRLVERITRIFGGAQSALNAPVSRNQPGAL